jgi:hypothetical protein
MAFDSKSERWFPCKKTQAFKAEETGMNLCVPPPYSNPDWEVECRNPGTFLPCTVLVSGFCHHRPWSEAGGQQKAVGLLENPRPPKLESCSFLAQ